MNNAERERYDAALDDPLAVECCVCTGHRDAPPCGEDCDRIFQQCRRERQIDACRHAIALIERMVAAYEREGFDDDTRIDVCRERVKYYEGQITKLQEAA